MPTEDWTFDAVRRLWERNEHYYEPEMLEALAQATYGWAADASGRALNVSRVVADRTRLDEILEGVRTVVDTTIAHADRKAAASNTMTYNQLDKVIHAVEDLAKRYIGLLTGRGYGQESGSMTPYEQTTWYRIFEPWQDLEWGRPRYAASDFCGDWIAGLPPIVIPRGL